MASDQRTVDFLVEQMASAGDVVAKKLFGEYAVYCDGKLVALICDDSLFVKPTAPGRQLLGEVTEAPPYPGAKPYLAIPADRWDDVLTKVNAHPQVAHNYERTHALNMWFVLATDTPDGIKRTAQAIEAETGLKVMLFPKLEEYFIGFRVQA